MGLQASFNLTGDKATVLSKRGASELELQVAGQAEPHDCRLRQMPDPDPNHHDIDARSRGETALCHQGRQGSGASLPACRRGHTPCQQDLVPTPLSHCQIAFVCVRCLALTEGL